MEQSNTIAKYVLDMRALIGEHLLSGHYNYILDLFVLEKCKELDRRGYHDNSIKGKYDPILNSLKYCGLKFTKHYETAFNLYNEIVIFDHLRSKNAPIEWIAANNEKRTPDFQLALHEKNVNVEMKTLSFADSEINFRAIQKQVDQVLKGAKKILKTSSSKQITEINDTSSRRDVVEGLINKLNGIYENGANEQLNYLDQDGILLVDMVIRQSTLFLFLQDALPTYIVDATHSGILWNACFGKKGDIIRQSTRDLIIDGERIQYIQKELTIDGILTFENGPSAIIFAIREGGPKGRIKLIGLYRKNKISDLIMNILKIVCDVVNDEKSSNTYNIAHRKMDELAPD